MARLCIVCVDEEATGQMRTCNNCRASMHRWERRPVGEILGRASKLRKYTRRMQQFAVIDHESEKVQRIDREALVEKGIMRFPGLQKRRARTKKPKRAVIEQ